MIDLLAYLLITIALIFMALGVVGLFRFKDFYSRILISAKIETVGFLTIMIGFVILSGFSYAAMKILLITLMVMITNPLSTHAIARSAFLSGYAINQGSRP
ncbi:monovalent cation/H(+) antiporter subunit G [Acetobacterium sp.]|jgi:multicomponent Na+:H+ antiporter subunit G|uniref:monovalent cation/H(+) antiporter subunit G n=1 Tax=Acetobacterium sp. TaxID=1872094 RepID=UPI002728CD78|nr:monovalent cation/H(+) antiporter subunit G [Acetobacterium sp.]MDO9493015.1 monovalent cation/H(+) antiporter subunit G [Acetobacterium sp.]